MMLRSLLYCLSVCIAIASHSVNDSIKQRSYNRQIVLERMDYQKDIEWLKEIPQNDVNEIFWNIRLTDSTIQYCRQIVESGTMRSDIQSILSEEHYQQYQEQDIHITASYLLSLEGITKPQVCKIQLHTYDTTTVLSLEEQNDLFSYFENMNIGFDYTPYKTYNQGSVVVGKPFIIPYCEHDRK